MWTKRNLLSAILAVAILLLAVMPARAATEEEIEQAIVDGLAWLAAQQNPDGSWGSSCRVAHTGMAVLKFESRAIELGLDPMGDDYEYSDQVALGLDYIVANAHDIAIGVQPAGDPDGNGNGKGVYFDDCGRPTYNTGIAMMAIAASGHPELYADILQDAVDYMAFGQCDAGWGRGGWWYSHNAGGADNSNSGYATLGLGYAVAPLPYGFELTIPPFVKDELSIWIDYIQNDVDGDTLDGGSGYTHPNDWVNILKTGNLIYEMALVGDAVDTQRVQDAIDYIERHWNDAGGCGTGWKDHRQAMFTMMKGFEAFGIDKIDLDGDSILEHDWFDEVSTHLVGTQNADGSWPPDCWAGQIMSTAWALLTLERAVPAVEIPVFVDIKPQSCPNPLNTKSKGVLPVAVLGTEDFDVTQIDPATVVLSREDVDEAVPVLRWAYEDVATPFEGELCDCHTLGPDGYLDLTLKFSTPKLVETLNLKAVAGGTIPLTLTGNLLEEFGGTPIRGQDCVWVLMQKGPQKP